ncbi:hypothetical protein [Hymenobacter rubripertinctus]|uniref:Uncharacterized protein n=1 Tax=Hymenobacter rubripertinctus TaxID=2029981 RepID=A0A418RA25_9BACT|nr:hypothetical protein [Hymenobacter rubripertinctus]RIY14246.1 hypothetical protein D0T11_00740 [Hymenobacter rubripertinctus]
MKRTFSLLRPAAAALLLTGLLSACNTGTDTGSTNVERGDNKSLDPAALHPDNAGADSATAGLRADTNRTTGRRQYEKAANAKDRNHDGIAD